VLNKLNGKWNPKGYGIKIGNETINNLCFADDIILVAKTPKELQQMLEDLHSMSEQKGLKINKSKSKIMFNTKTTPNHKIQVEGQELESVQSYIYPGQLFSLDGDSEVKIKRRIAIAWSRFGKLGRYLLNPKFPSSLKRKMHCTCLHIWLRNMDN